MRRIYAIYATVDLLDQPKWLVGFRAKYDGIHNFHVTLKQMAYIDVNDLHKIKHMLEEVLETIVLPKQKLRLEFGNVDLCKYDTDDGKGYIYVFANQRNDILDTFQKIIREKFSNYSNYYFKDSRTYEFDFNPHLTVASKLDVTSFSKAVSELPKKVILTGEISSIVLSCVEDLSLKESSKPENFSVYRI